MLFIYRAQFLLTLISTATTSNSLQYFQTNETVFPAISSKVFDFDVPSSSSRYKFPPAPSIYQQQHEEMENSVISKNHLNPIVWIKDGGLRGFTMESISGTNIVAFQSIPFAMAPVGELRFLAPVKNSRWTGVRDAIAESPTCLQTDFIRQYKIIGSEDCLYLNVYTPKVPRIGETSNLAVMVFIHGGGFFFGSSNLYGPSYLLDENVILVSMNYRLGPFGFFTTGDEAAYGNQGLKDQTLAFKWVQQNIYAFGGDPSKVTIFGESAGAGSVQLHMLSPLSQGLFHAGISQSGSAFCAWSISEKAVEIGKNFATLFNCTTTNSKLTTECLRNVDGADLVKGQLHFLKWTLYPVVIFGPIIEAKHRGAFLDESPESTYKAGRVAPVPWLTGYNANEGGLNIATILLNPVDTKNVNDDWDRIGPILLDMDGASNSVGLVRIIRKYYLGDRAISFENRQDSTNMFGDRYLNMCGMKSIKYHAQYSSTPVYAYHFNYVSSIGIVQFIGQNPKDWGPTHLDELIYLMNNTLYYSDIKRTDVEYKMSKIMTNVWSNFAKTGKPLLTLPTNNTQADIWKPVDGRSAKMQFLNISLEPEMIIDPFLCRVNFWNSLSIDSE